MTSIRQSSVRSRAERLRIRRRARVALPMAMSLVGSLLVAGTLAQAAPAAAEASSVSSVSVPSVPLQQPPLYMACLPGQIDLNHASLADLQQLPDVSGPVAQRIVDARPHDRVKDLLAVPGIGPDELAAIASSGRACSTPFTLPPPAPNVCLGASQIDLNDPADQDQLAALFGGPTAARLVAAQPFPDLAHAETVLAAGAGPGKVRKFAAQLCVTPEPKIFNGTSYSWVYSTAGGRADYQGFSLVVPAGVLVSGTGQWITIEPQSTPTPHIMGQPWPSADFTVLGQTWQDGTKKVYVTLPIDPTLGEFGSNWEPIVAHWADTQRSAGEQVSGNDVLVDSVRSTVTIAVTHLSVIDALDRAVQWVAEPLGNVLADARFPAPTCAGDWSLQSSTGDWYGSDGGRVQLDSAYLNLPGGPIPPLGWPIKHCVEGGGGTDATLRLRNNTRTFMSLTTYGGTTPTLGKVNVGGDLLQLSMAKGAELVLGHPVAYPGGEVTATVPAGTFNAVRMKPNIPLTVVWTILDQSPLEDLLKKLPRTKELVSAVESTVNCVLSSYGVSSLNSASDPQAIADAAVGYISDCFTPEEFFQAVAAGVGSGAISSDVANGVSSTLDQLSRYSVWLRIGQVTLSGVDSLLNASGSSSAGIVGISYYKPKPTVDAIGNTVQAQCLSAHGYGWIVDQACQDNIYNAVNNPPSGSGSVGSPGHYPAKIIVRDPATGDATLWDPATKSMYLIRDQATYICLAQRYVVDYAPLPGEYVGTIFVSPVASCDPTTPTATLTPTAIPTNATVLREGTGRAWLVTNGIRQEIPTGDEYNCWVSGSSGLTKQFVWDWVPSTVLSNFPEDPTQPYVPCIPPPPPTY